MADYRRRRARQLGGLCAVLCLLGATPGRTDGFVEPSGHVELEVDARDNRNVGLDVQGKLKLRTRRIKKIRAVMKVEAGFQDMAVRVEDLYFDYKPHNRFKLTLGLSKKILGMEYQNNKRDRLTVHRSPIYQKMEELGLVGRQINLRFHGRLGSEENGWRLSGALGGDNSRNYNLQLSARRTVGEWGYGGWFLGEIHRVDKDYIPVHAEAIGMWYDSGRGRLALEWFLGVDAPRTEFERLFAAGRTVYFSGPKAEFSMNFKLGRVRVAPMVQASFWMNDLAAPEQNTLFFLGGLAAHIVGIRISFNAATYGVRDDTTDEQRLFNQERFYGEVAFFF